MRICAIDPGRHFGWAILEGKTVQDSGVVHLSEDMGVASTQIHAQLDLVATECQTVWCESRPFRASSNQAAEWAGVIRGAVRSWCAEHRVGYDEVAPQSWKARVLGKGDMPPDAYTQFISIRVGRRLLPDEAAAIGIGMYGAAMERIWAQMEAYRIGNRGKLLEAATAGEVVALAVRRGDALPVNVRGYNNGREQMIRRLWK